MRQQPSMKNFPVNKISCRQKAARRLSAQNIKSGQPLFLKKRADRFFVLGLSRWSIKGVSDKGTIRCGKKRSAKIALQRKEMKSLNKPPQANNPAREILVNEKIKAIYKRNGQL